MWRLLLISTLLLGILGDISVGLEKEQESRLYLPLLQKSPTNIEVVVTARGELIGYPTYYYVYGYVRSLVPDPLYSVNLEVEVTIYPYCEPPDDPCDPYTEYIPVSPALTGTLPNQINPFSFSLLLGKASASIGEVRAASTSRSEPGGKVYYPLEVTSWEHKDGTLLGSVRNDSGLTLQDVRLVAAELKKCSWREAQLENTMLKPRHMTSFELKYPEACMGENLVIVGQGAALP